MALLRDYHAALGPIVARYEGTLQQRVVRHCHLPEREIMTGIGPVRQPWVRATAKLLRANAPGTRHRSCRGTRGARSALSC